MCIECKDLEKKVYRAGRCRSCYDKIKPRATCHPDKPHAGLGLCNACYRRQRYHENPDRYRHAAIEDYHTKFRLDKENAIYLKRMGLR